MTTQHQNLSMGRVAAGTKKAKAARAKTLKVHPIRFMVCSSFVHSWGRRVRIASRRQALKREPAGSVHRRRPRFPVFSADVEYTNRTFES